MEKMCKLFFTCSFWFCAMVSSLYPMQDKLRVLRGSLVMLKDRLGGLNKRLQGLKDALDSQNGNATELVEDLKKFRDKIKKNLLISEGSDVAQAIKKIQSSKSIERKQALQQFKIWLDVSQNIKETELAAIEAVLTKDPFVQKTGQDLFVALVSKNKAFYSAPLAASLAMEVPNIQIHYAGISLFQALFAKGEGFHEAKNSANDAMKAGERKIHAINERDKIIARITLDKGLQLFETLVKKNKGHYWAAQAALLAVSIDDKFIEGKAIKLFEVLATQNEKGLTYARGIALVAVKSDDKQKRKAGVVLYQVLISKRWAHQELFKKACKEVLSEDPLEREKGFSVLAYLGSVYNDIATVTFNIQSADKDKRDEALKKAEDLFKADNGFEEGIHAASLATQSKISGVHDSGLALFKMLVVWINKIEDDYSRKKMLEKISTAIDLLKQENFLSEDEKLGIESQWKFEVIQEIENFQDSLEKSIPSSPTDALSAQEIKTLPLIVKLKKAIDGVKTEWDTTKKISNDFSQIKEILQNLLKVSIQKKFQEECQRLLNKLS